MFVIIRPSQLPTVLIAVRASSTTVRSSRHPDGGIFRQCRINEGDIAFSKYGTRGIPEIPDYCKRAVIELDEQREWVFSGAVSRTECEGCGNTDRSLVSILCVS